MKKFLIVLSILISFKAVAQNASKPKTLLCNPLIIGNIPKKPLMVQYEFQSGFTMPSKNNVTFPVNNTTLTNNTVQSLKLAYNKTIITKPKTYASIDVSYTNTKFNFNSSPSIFINPIPSTFNNTAFHSVAISSNVFKPLNAKNFLIINIGLEANGSTNSIKTLGGKNLFVSGAIIYGTKKSFNEMTGFGILRAYRLGRVVHVPAFLWNKNFNRKWGVEMLLPARALVRYTPNTKTIVNMGYELEGNQFSIETNNYLNNTFLQRGEIRPKIGFETTLSKNIKLMANAGVRINGRFDIATTYDGKNLVLENNPAVNGFINIGFALMSFTKSKSKK